VEATTYHRRLRLWLPPKVVTFGGGVASGFHQRWLPKVATKGGLVGWTAKRHLPPPVVTFGVKQSKAVNQQAEITSFTLLSELNSKKGKKVFTFSVHRFYFVFQ
jgi:hypothetical protein